MRPILVLVVLLAAAPAQAGGTLPRLDTITLPSACRWTADVPANAPPRQQLAAIISAANCSAMFQLRAADRDASAANARKLEHALAPSFALLDSVIATGDTEAQIVAQYAKGDLLSGMRVFLLSSVPRVGSMTGRDLATYTARIDRAIAIARPYSERAAIAFGEVRRLAATPDARALAAQDPVVAYAIRNTRPGAPVISRR